MEAGGEAGEEGGGEEGEERREMRWIRTRRKSLGPTVAALVGVGVWGGTEYRRNSERSAPITTHNTAGQNYTVLYNNSTGKL